MHRMQRIPVASPNDISAPAAPFGAAAHFNGPNGDVSSSVALQHDDTSSTGFPDTVSPSQQQRRAVVWQSTAPMNRQLSL
jgi:hypothetical protein